MIKIHDKLWVVTHTTRDENNIAYMTYYEENSAFEKRKATGLAWAQDRYRYDETAPAPTEVTYENAPTKGFVISDSVSRWSTQNKVFRVYDPREFTVEVPTGNISTLLKYTTVINGVIQEECVWGREGNNHVLLPVNSEPYIEAKRDTQAMEKRIPYSQLTFGDTFKKSVDDDTVYTYLGKVKPIWRVVVKERKANHRHSTLWEIWEPISDNDEVISDEIIKDTKWSHMYTYTRGSKTYFDIIGSGKVIKTGNITCKKPQVEDIDLWMPDRLKSGNSCDRWHDRSSIVFVTNDVVDIEWKE